MKSSQTPISPYRFNRRQSTQQKKRRIKYLFLVLIIIVLPVFGLFAAKNLTNFSQDLRQQANGQAACVGYQSSEYVTDQCGAGMEHCVSSTVTCAGGTLIDSGSFASQLERSEALNTIYQHFYYLNNPCRPHVVLSGGPTPYTYHYTVTIATNNPIYYRCANTYCYCSNGEQQGESGPGTCVHPNGSSYPVADRPNCKASTQTGSTASCAQFHNNASGCNSVSPALPGNAALSATCAYYQCSNQCHPRGTSNCSAGCGGCSPGGGGGGGGTGSPSPVPTPIPTINPNRTISGSVKCTNTLSGTGPFSQPYGIKNVPVAAFAGTPIVPAAVSKNGNTDAVGNYQLDIQQTNPVVSIRLTSDNQYPEKVFARDGNPAITCTDTYAYEVCSYFDIPETGISGINFKTTSRAENLRGFRSGNMFVFEFTKAKDILNVPVQQYIVRLDNTANSWFNPSDKAPDYFLYVPARIGSCDSTKCRITSTQLSTIRPFVKGTYEFNVNPVMPSKSVTNPNIELCRNRATFTASTGETERK